MRRIAVAAVAAALIMTTSVAGSALAASVWHLRGQQAGHELGFFPSTVTIHVGQAITFAKHDPTEPPSGSVAELLPSGPPPYTYDGKPATAVHSGFLLTQAQCDFYHLALTGLPLVPRTRVRITFTRPARSSTSARSTTRLECTAPL